MTTVKAWLDASPIARRDAEFLISDVTNLSRAQLLSRPETVISTAHEQDLKEKLARLQSGTPLAYVLGEWEFWGLTLSVNEHTLVPRPDTELLVELAIEIAPTNAHLVDLGTGSGAIAIALAKERPDLRVTATDISREALKLAAKNARHHDVPIIFKHSNWFRDIGTHFDMVVSNPPYIAENDPHLPSLNKEPIQALVAGADGLADLSQIIPRAREHLNPTGTVLVEHGYDQGAATRALFADSGYSKIATHRDLGDNERVSLGYI